MKKFAFISTLFVAFVAIPVAAQGTDSSWIVRAGTYSGQSVAINRSLATKKSSRFWRISSTRGDSRIVGWNPSSLPAKVAFHNSRIDASDSTAFWSILRKMEADMGMRLFEPTTLAVETNDENIIVVDLKSMIGSEGVTYITWGATGAPYDARVYVSSRSLLHDQRVVTHELMHALGFGHTGAWESIMNSGSSGPERLTAQDVAYAQAAFASRANTEREDMWARLALAVSRDDQHDGGAGCAEDDFNPVVAASFAEARLARAELPTVNPLRSSSCFR